MLGAKQQINISSDGSLKISLSRKDAKKLKIEQEYYGRPKETCRIFFSDLISSIICMLGSLKETGKVIYFEIKECGNLKDYCLEVMTKDRVIFHGPIVEVFAEIIETPFNGRFPQISNKII